MNKGRFAVGVAALLLAISSVPAYAATNAAAHTPRQSTITHTNPRLISTKTYTAKDLGYDVVVPPANFNPLTATAAELAKYHFPSRPTDSKDLQAWTNEMSHYTGFVDPQFQLAQKVQPRKVASGSIYNAWSPNWSGYVAHDGGYTDCKANWTVPSIDAVSQPIGSCYSVTWVGIGGYGSQSNGLIQAGTEQDATVDAYQYNTQYYYGVWWEVYPYNYEQNISNFYISPGDNMYVDIAYSGGTFSWYIEDVTTGKATSGSQSGISGYYDGSTAEWIVERPGENGSLSSLADFQSETFTNSHTNSTVNGEQYMGDQDTYHVEMTSDGSQTGTPLANASSQTTTSQFTDYWHNYN